jgi:hypothetical protein
MGLPPEGETASWHWSFGDGTTSTSRNPSHVYSSGGTFEVTSTVAVTGAGRAAYSASLTLDEPEPADPVLPVQELAYGSSGGGRYVTNWTHRAPGLSLTIVDGWGIADTLTGVDVGPRDAWGNRTCNPLVRITVPQVVLDPTTGVMVPTDDLEDALRNDARFSLVAETSAKVGGFPATRFDGTLNLDKVDLSWRFCGPGVRTFAIGAADLGDPSYKWIWLPAQSNLSFWVVHVEASDVLVAVAHLDLDEPGLAEVEALVASIEFHVPRDPVLTRTLHSEFGDIEIFNGTPRLHSLVDWSLGRYSGSGLGSPGVWRVAFSADVECHERGYAGGFTEIPESGAHVRLCFGDEQPESQARRTVLHEFAHAWLEANRDDRVRTEFRSLFGLEAWYPAGSEQPAAAVEYAADVIAWGLLGEAELPRRLAGRSCESVKRAFLLLTETKPLTDPAVCDR